MNRIAIAVISPILVLLSSIALHAQTPQSLQIIQATYGVGETQMDVTEKIQSLVQSGQTNVRVGNHLFGKDPMFGKVKTLSVLFSENGVQYHTDIREGEQLSFSEPNLSQSDVARQAPSTPTQAEDGQLASQADPSYKAFRKESAKLWDAVLDNKYAYIGKSVQWMIRVEYTSANGVLEYPEVKMYSVMGDMFPGRHGKYCVSLRACNASDATEYDRAAMSIISPDKFPKAGEWITFEGVIVDVSKGSETVTVAPLSFSNMGQHDDW